MPPSDIRAGRAFVELFTKDAALVRGLEAARRRLHAFGTGIASMGVKLSAIATGALTPLLAGFRHFADVGDNLHKMAGRTGLAVESLSELGFAAEQSGADLATLEKGVVGMQRNILNAERGLSTAVDTLSDLGLAVEDLEGLNPEAQFKLIADRIASIEDPSRKAALALQVFGRAGQRLLPLLSEGAGGITALQAEAASLGLTVSTEQAEAAAHATDQMNILARVLKAGVFAAGSALVPVMRDVVKNLIGAASAATRWITENRELIATVFKIAGGVAAFGSGLIVVGTAIVGVGAVLGGVATILTTIGAAIGALLSPIGLAGAALVGLGTAFVTMTDTGSAALSWLGETFGRLRDAAAETFGAIADALAAGDIGLAARVLWLRLRVAWEEGVNYLFGLWNQFKTGTAKVFVETWSLVRQTMAIAVDAMARAWEWLLNTMERGWKGTQGLVGRGWLYLQSLWDDSFDYDVAVKELDKQLRPTERSRPSGELTQQQMEIEQDRQDAIAELDKMAAEAVGSSRPALEVARKALQEAIEEAAAARAAVSTPEGPARPNFEGIASGAQQAAAAGVSIAGSFSGASAERLAFAGGASDRLTKASETTAQATGRIADLSEDILTETRRGLSFT